jgi:prepilin-type processing-associated H-X9-DG protein
VVLVIIGILMALLLPAVQKAREAARVASCANNLRQIGLALANFEARQHYYPPSMSLPAAWSAQAMLLPYLEQTKLFSNINFDRSYEEAADVQTADGTTVRLSAMRVPTYICPSERRDEVKLEDGLAAHYPLNYAVNLGDWFIYDPLTGRGGNGPFYPASRVRAADLRDGASFTLCAAEVKAWQPYYRNARKLAGELTAIPSSSQIGALGGQFKTGSGHTEWVDGRAHQSGFTAAFGPNTQVLCDQGGTTYDCDWTNQQEGLSTTAPTFAAVTARSYHGGGVNTVLMDGSVRWFADTVNLGVWRAYATLDGGELIPAADQGR